jgi:hypothetical protein
MRSLPLEKRYSEETGKLHVPCPFAENTGIRVHVVIKGGYCYRSEDCMILRCKFSRLQADLESLLSLTW